MTEPASNKMKHYFKVYRAFIANSFSFESQYRADTIVSLIMNFVWIGTIFFGIELVFANTKEVAGWSKTEMYVLALVWSIVGDMYVTFFGKTAEIPDDVTDGKLDVWLTKPLNNLFLSCLNQFYFRALYRFILQLILLSLVIIFFHLSVNLIGILYFIPLLCCGVLIEFSMKLLLSTLAFWLDRINNISALLDNGSYYGRYPLEIWPKYLKTALLSIIPIVFYGFIPAAALLGKLSWVFIIYAPLLTIVFLILTVYFWNYAIRHYSSASS